MKKQLLSIVAAFTIALILTHTQAQTPMLWGMTSNGGKYGGGNIFESTLSGTVTDVYDFGSVSGTNGQSPRGALIQATNGLLYGLTESGGANTDGVLFSYNISTGKEKVLHNFAGGTDGEDPGYSLIQASNGVLYGTTAPGGMYIDGVLFSYDIADSTYTVLWGFGNNADNDGKNPHGNLVQVGDSLLYGTTEIGGTHNQGTVFSFNIVTNKEQVLHNFRQAAESGPTGTLTLANDGLLYGMAYAGGTYGEGAIYSFNTVTDSVNGVYYIGTNGGDGYNPQDALVQADNGLLYGMTLGGGAHYVGVILSCNDTTEQELVLSSFGNGNDGTVEGPDGVYPYGSLIQASNGLIYGMTESGGVNSEGTIFSYNISTDTEINIHSFAGVDGAAPYGDLLEVDTPVFTTGMNQLSVNNNQLSVYPNPTSDYIHTSIQLKQPSDLQLHLVNMFGQTVWSADAVNVNSYQNNISVADLADGVYLLEMVTGGGMETKKIMVAR